LACSAQHEATKPTFASLHESALGRLAIVELEHATQAFAAGNLTIKFADVGNRTSLAAAIDGTDDFLNTYTYDDLYRLTRVTQEEQSGGNSVSDKRVDFAYNALGQWSSITRYASLDTSELVATTGFSYDLANRLTALTHQDNTPATFAGYGYTYDAANRITSIDSFLDGLSEYTYDSAGQLTDADHATQTDEEYAYDDNGNRIGGDYDTDPNNLTIEDNDYTYGYDDEGNRVLRTDKTTGDYVEYTWDHRNRLTLVTFKNSSNTTTKQVAYEYDAFDRRVRKRVDTDGNSSWDRGEQYVYDGAHIALQFDDSGDLARRNLFGPAIDQVLASEFIGSPNDTHWYFADHLGTVRDVYSYDDVLNDLVSEGHIEYDSFGNIVDGAVVAEEAHFAYTGREWDADTELFYYRARWYDAKLGQFISQDPIGFAAGDANVRRYVGNSSLIFVDPNGLERLRAKYNLWTTSGTDELIASVELTMTFVAKCDPATGTMKVYEVAGQTAHPETRYAGWVDSVESPAPSVRRSTKQNPDDSLEIEWQAKVEEESGSASNMAWAGGGLGVLAGGVGGFILGVPTGPGAVVTGAGGGIAGGAAGGTIGATVGYGVGWFFDAVFVTTLEGRWTVTTDESGTITISGGVTRNVENGFATTSVRWQDVSNSTSISGGGLSSTGSLNGGGPGMSNIYNQGP
jgi:RHS repeat-associated protein